MRFVITTFNTRFFILLTASMMMSTGLCGDREKYLAAAGPTPLRFSRELPEFNPAWLLPKLDMGDGTTSASTTEKAIEPAGQAPTTAAAPEAPAAELDLPVTQPAVEATSPVVNEALPAFGPPAMTERQTSGMSSQMLLRYFPRNGTNEVLVPYNVEFTPPVKASGTGSSAEYISK